MQSGDQLILQLSQYIRRGELPKLQPVDCGNAHRTHFNMDPRHLQYLNWRFDQSPVIQSSHAADNHQDNIHSTIRAERSHSEQLLPSSHSNYHDRSLAIKSLSTYSLSSNAPGRATLTIDQDLLVIYRYLGIVEILRLIPAGKLKIDDPIMEGRALMVDLRCFRSLTRLHLISVSPDCITGLVPRFRFIEELLCRGVELQQLRRLLIAPIAEDQRRRKGKARLGADRSALIDGDFNESTAVDNIAIASSWSALKSLIICMNSLVALDRPSTRLIRNCARLDLSHNSLEQLPDALAHIYSLDTLNLSYNNLLNVYEAPTCLGNITTLNLSHNQLESTRGLEKLWSLRSLDLTFNLIRSADDICEISGLPELEELRVAGNPFCSDEKVNYRAQIFGAFGKRSSQLFLDGSRSSIMDRLRARQWLSSASQNGRHNQTAHTAPAVPTLPARSAVETCISLPNNHQATVDADACDNANAIKIGNSSPKMQPTESPLSQTVPVRSTSKAMPIAKNSRISTTEEPGQSYKRRIEALKMEAGSSWIRVYQSMQQQQSFREKLSPPPERLNFQFNNQSLTVNEEQRAKDQTVSLLSRRRVPNVNINESKSTSSITDAAAAKQDDNISAVPVKTLKPLTKSTITLASPDLIKASADIVPLNAGGESYDTISIISGLSRNIRVPTVLGPFLFSVSYNFVDIAGGNQKQRDQGATQKKIIINPDYLYEIRIGEDSAAETILPFDSPSIKWNLRRLLRVKRAAHRLRCDFRAGPQSMDILELSSGGGSLDEEQQAALRTIERFLKKVLSINNNLDGDDQLFASPPLPRNRFEWKCMNCSQTFQDSTDISAFRSKQPQIKCPQCESLFTVRVKIDSASLPTTPLTLSPPVSPLLHQRSTYRNAPIVPSQPQTIIPCADLKAPIESWETIVWAAADGLLAPNSSSQSFIPSSLALTSNRKLHCWPIANTSDTFVQMASVKSLRCVKIGPFRRYLTIFYHRQNGQREVSRLKFILREPGGCVEFVDRLRAWMMDSELIEDDVCSRWWLDAVLNNLWLPTVTALMNNADRSLPLITEDSIKLYLIGELQPSEITAAANSNGISNWLRWRPFSSPAAIPNSICSLIVVEDFVFVVAEAHYRYPVLDKDDETAQQLSDNYFQLLFPGRPIQQIQEITRLSSQSSRDYGLHLKFKDDSGGTEWRVKLLSASCEQDAFSIMSNR